MINKQTKQVIFEYSLNNNNNVIATYLNNNKQLEWYKTFLDVAKLLGERSHCISKKVGSIITKDNRIISTGINGTPENLLNCDDIFNNNFDITNEENRKIHHNFSTNYEIHSEVNSIIYAAKNGISIKDSTLFVNYFPCKECSKAILASGISTIVFENFYDLDLYGFSLIMLSKKIKVYHVFNNTDKNYKIIAKTTNFINDELINNNILKNKNPFIK